MLPEQKKQLIRLLQAGDDISTEWARILFPPEKREYELVYHGKDREEDIIANTLAVPLQRVRTFGRIGPEWHNMLIFGDNLQTMKTLLEMKREGKLCNSDGTAGVRLVYIDPPFATKQDFRGTDDQKAYQDKIAGAEFLEFLRKRLVLLRELLADDGSIYVHLDTRKSHYMKILMDEVFGESNFINEIIWKRTSAHSDSKTYANVHDTILFYSRSSTFKYHPQYQAYSEEHIEERYKHSDPDGRKFADGDLVGTGLKGGGYTYEWKGVTRNWRCPIETMRQYDKEKRLYYTREGVARIKRYLEDVKGVAPTDVWLDVYPVNSQAAERVGYPTQKSESLLERLISSSSREGDIVFDAFAGSGTTLAVAEKLGRRWIGVDCGKLAIYTIQKRLLNLQDKIGNRGKKLEVSFTLNNAGLYDFSKLRELPWQDWRFFALQLFQCRDDPHKINGVEFDGYRQGASVMVFNHMDSKHKDARITEDTILEIHEAVGERIENKVFIVAPAMTFDFQQDYIDLPGVRYYALRIPYSIIHELHRREFTALKQPADELAVNDTVEAVGFDFIRTPELKYKIETEKPKGTLFENGSIKIETFRSDAVVREPYKKKGNLETLSTVMLDFDYDEETKVFDLDEVHYADTIEKDGWKVTFRLDQLGKKMMAVFLDIYGNENRILIDASEFQPKKETKEKAAKKKDRKKK